MNITILDGYTLNPGDNPWTPIEDLGSVRIYDRTPTEKTLERASDAQVLLTNKTAIPGDILNALPNLEYISVLATGYDVVDVRAAAERGIPVSNVPGYSTPAVAQHVFAMILELASKTAAYDRATKDGEWGAQPDFCHIKFPQAELQDKKLGIVGFGSIGQATARIGQAFGMKILAYAPRPKAQPQWGPVEFVDLDQLFEQADVVSLHCPQTEENKGFINKALITRMKASAMIVNTARGTLINEPDLADALNSGVIAGAGLDVVAEEPVREDNPLMSAKNCLITPHIAWATLESRQRLMHQTAANIRAFQERSPINVVNGVSFA